MDKLQHGDIGLVRLGNNPLSWFMRLAGRLGIIPKQKHDHALLFFWVPGGWPGDRYPWCVEAAPPEVDDRRLSQADIDACDWYRVDATKEQRVGAINWALDQRGEKYDWKDNAAWALELIADWIRKLLGMERVITLEYYKCTHLVGAAYWTQNIDLAPGKALNRLWPTTDIADSELTRKLELG